MKTGSRGQKNFALGPLKAAFEQWCRSHGYDERLTFLAAWSAFAQLDEARRTGHFRELPAWTERMLGGPRVGDAAPPEDANGLLRASLLPDGTVVSVSRSLLGLAGASADEALGRPLWQLCNAPRSRAAIRRAIDGLSGGKPGTLRLTVRRAGGRTARVRLSLTGYFDSDGDLTFCQAEGAPDG
ncbi:MAG: PAS domain-containing protein [Planctomycetota bacterium]|jgi:PAS domain S-box-containing protein